MSERLQEIKTEFYNRVEKLQNHISTQHVEIERLRDEYLNLDEKLEQALRKNENQATLISKLADGLDKAVAYMDIDNLTMQMVATGFNKLSKEAREAAKE